MNSFKACLSLYHKVLIVRNLLFLMIPLLLFISCKEEAVEEELEPIYKDSFYGKWQLVEKWDGVMSDPYEVEDGYFYTFNSDSTCSTTHPTIGCPSNYEFLTRTYGLYEDEKGYIMKMEFICEEREEGIIPNALFRYELNDGFLTILPHEDHITCDEGCWERFKKVANEEK